MDVPDKEIEQLYAERYRREDSPQIGSPIIRDSLENSSDSGNSSSSVSSSLRSTAIDDRFRHRSQNSSIRSKIHKFEEASKLPQPAKSTRGGLLQIATERNVQIMALQASRRASGNNTEIPRLMCFHSDSNNSERRILKTVDALTVEASPQSAHLYSRRGSENHRTASVNNSGRSSTVNKENVPSPGNCFSSNYSQLSAQVENAKHVSSTNRPRESDYYRDEQYAKKVAQHTPTQLQSRQTLVSDSEPSPKAVNIAQTNNYPDNVSVSPSVISKLFREESQRANCPVSSAIKNLLAYQQLQDESRKILRDELQKQYFSDPSNHEKQENYLPPVIPRRPTLLRAVTENQHLENSNLTPAVASPSSNPLRPQCLTPVDRSIAQSPPYYYGENAMQLQFHAHKVILDDSRNLNSSHSQASPSRNVESSSSRIVNHDFKLATPSPRIRTEQFNNELSNPAGLLAFVTRNSNSPHMERSVTGLLKNRASYCGTPVNEIFSEAKYFHVNSPESSFLVETENMNPVKVLPSNTDSKGLVGMFRNLQRSPIESSLTREKLLDDNSVFQFGTASKEKNSTKEISITGAKLVATIGRSMSKNMKLSSPEPRLVLLSDTNSMTSNHKKTEDKVASNIPQNLNFEETRSGMDYKTFQNEPDSMSSSSCSSPDACKLSQDVAPSSADLDPPQQEHPVDHRALDESSGGSSSEGLVQRTGAGGQSSGDPRGKFWRFTTRVIFPKPYPDHPERDSLDGNLPGSSHGTGNPPPPPAPPHPHPPPDSAKPHDSGAGLAGSTGFIKGPNAPKNKKGGCGGKQSRGDMEGEVKGEQETRDSLSPLEKKHLSKKNKDLHGGFLGSSRMRDRDMDGPGGYRNMKEP